jgi:hypothetical protein
LPITPIKNASRDTEVPKLDYTGITIRILPACNNDMLRKALPKLISNKSYRTDLHITMNMHLAMGVV